MATPRAVERAVGRALGGSLGMGWSFSRGFRLGPLRLSVSRSGVGVSVGVRGLRVCTGPRGAYVSAGAGGLRYRAKLDATPAALQRPRQPRAWPAAPAAPEPVATGHAGLLEVSPGVSLHPRGVPVYSTAAQIEAVRLQREPALQETRRRHEELMRQSFAERRSAVSRATTIFVLVLCLMGMAFMLAMRFELV